MGMGKLAGLPGAPDEHHFPFKVCNGRFFDVAVNIFVHFAPNLKLHACILG